MKRLMIFALAAIFGCANLSLAQGARPLSDVLEDWQGYSWSDIQDIAAWEAQNDGPLYPSAPATTPHYESFEGNFTPVDNNTKISVFSDDGCDVFVNGAKVHSAKGRGQALPYLSQSLHRIDYNFQGGQTYRIRVEYSNTVYLGSADIDGASLFAYTSGSVTPTPIPTATPTPVPTPCPIELNVDDVDWNTVDLSWNECEDADFVSYKLYRSTEADFVPSESTYINRGDDETTISAVIFEDTGLLPNTTYHYALVTAHAGDSTETRASTTTSNSQNPSVKFEGLARACAGGITIANGSSFSLDGVHDFTITGTAKAADGSLLANASFKAIFENNKGHDYGDGRAKRTAKFVGGVGTGQLSLVEEMQVTTDSNGQFSLTVLSSDIISTGIKIKIKWADQQGAEKEVGGQSCDFAEAESIRRFPNWIEPEEEDTGWLFGQGWLSSPGSQTTAKVYLKFLVNPALGDVDGNWKEVYGHQMFFKVDSVITRDGASANNTSNFAQLIPNKPNGATVHETVPGAHGDAGGSATAVIQAGANISDAEAIWVVAYNQSQWEQ